MADPKIVKYVKDTLSQGFSEEQIRSALLNQGWYREEVDEAFMLAKGGAAKPSPKPEPVATKPAAQEKAAQKSFSVQTQKKAVSKPSGKPFGGFILSVAGGALVLVNALLAYMGMGSLLSYFVENFSYTFIDLLSVTLMSFDIILINMLLGAILVALGLMVYLKPSKAQLTGVFIIIIALISIIIGGGYLIGGIVALFGGIMTLLKR